MRTNQKHSRWSRMQPRSFVPVYFPVSPNNFPVRAQKIPGYVATGIRPQPIDKSPLFSRSNSRIKAESTRFPVIFPVHGNWRRHGSSAALPRGSAPARRPTQLEPMGDSAVPLRRSGAIGGAMSRGKALRQVAAEAYDRRQVSAKGGDHGGYTCLRW